MAPEVDDFGLPIRRFPTPEPAPEPTTPEEKKPQDAHKPKVEEEKKDAVEPEKVEEKVSAPAEKKELKEESKEEDSDDKFEDARTEQEPPVVKQDTSEKSNASPKAEIETSEIPDAPKESKPQPQDTESQGNSKEDTVRSEPTAVEHPASPSSDVDKEVTTDVKPEVKTDIKTDDKTDVKADVKADVKTDVKTTGPPDSSPSTSKDVEATNPPPDSTSHANKDDKKAHNRGLSTASGPQGEVSEYSHQQFPKPPVEETPEDQGWQTMPSYARYDMYDDDDRLVAKEFNEETDETEKYGYADLGGAGKGYTRVLMDDDAESVTSMDENTQYLFRETQTGTSMMDDDEARDAMSQMQATKDLLTEGQRIAYVGIVRLEMAEFVKEMESLESTRRTKKDVGFAIEAMRMWGQKMMLRLYGHMDISAQEQVMIEQLAEHGVVPSDLTPALQVNARVQNPMADYASTRGSISSPRPDSFNDEKGTDTPPPYEANVNGDVPEVQTPSQLPTTSKIDIDLRWTVLCDLFLILIADSIYDARSRVLLERVAKSLNITWIDICRFEKKVTDALEMQQAAEKENWNEDEHMESRRKRALKKRYLMMGLATVGGGLVIGLSAGLLAPVIGAGLAAGFTTIGVTGTSSFLAGAGGAAIITSSAAASGSIIGVRAADRRTGAVQTFEYRPLHNNKRVNLIVTVSGWLTGKVDDVRLPFSTVDPIMGDLYSVLWEPDLLRSMGDTINILATEALTQGLQQILGSTILVALMSAIQLPIILTKLSYLIDNPWAVSLDRATAAGKILADSLRERGLGTRPITLVGYSLGSRVIFSCLQELAKHGCYGVIQNVYLFGSPVVVKKEEYLRARTMVSGRFVNGFNRNDWILGYLFRLTNGGIRRVAGLAAIEDCPWIENLDVTDTVMGHMDYRQKMPSLLMKCGWSVDSEVFTEIEDPDPENHQERQRELINEIEEARRQLEKEGKAGKSSRFSIFGRRKKGERQAWEVYEDSAGKPAEKKPEEKPEGANTGVLFDIDAIRAELAKEARYGDTEELQVKEIKSTLPPMKLDISLPGSPAPEGPNGSKPQSSLRETQSAEVLPMRSSLEVKKSREPSPSYGYDRQPSPAYGYDRQSSPALGLDRQPSPAYGSYGYDRQPSPSYGYERQPSYSYSSKPQPPPVYGESHHDDDIQMTFDTSFHEDPKPVVPPKDEPLHRPELKPAQTLPNMTAVNPWGDPDDDDFGKEKEISMTFA